MAELPRILAESNVPSSVSLPRADPTSYGEAAGTIAQAFAHISDEYDASASKRLQQEAAAQMEGALKLSKQEATDPDEYYSLASGRVQDIQDSVLASAKNDKIKS